MDHVTGRRKRRHCTRIVSSNLTPTYAMAKDIHFKEDTSKPENRVNISLFHLMMVDDIKSFVFDKLKIPRTSLLYPSPNLTTEEFDINLRPDYVVTNGTEPIAYIEVEIGPEDKSQLVRYRSEQRLPVYSIIGKRSYGDCDLSLEEIYSFLKSIQPKFKGTQSYQSIHLLTTLIDYYVIQENVYHQKPIPLSDAMKRSKLVSQISEYFGKGRVLENAPIERNKIMFNTRADNGLSLRIYSPETNSGGLSLLNRTAGREVIYFPSEKKLLKYLPDRKTAVLNYTAFISKLGAIEISRIEENKRCSLSLDTVEDNVVQLCKLIQEMISI